MSTAHAFAQVLSQLAFNIGGNMAEYLQPMAKENWYVMVVAKTKKQPKKRKTNVVNIEGAYATSSIASL